MEKHLVRWHDLTAAAVSVPRTTGTILYSMLYHASHDLFYSIISSFAFLTILAIYRLYFHPLAHIPGPRIAALSNVWLALQTRSGQTFHLSTTLHAKYGPVIRLGPNEIWVCSPEGLRAIYATSPPAHPAYAHIPVRDAPLNKSEFYLASALQQPERDWRGRVKEGAERDSLDLLSERDGVRYRRQRRMLGGTYSAAAMGRFRPMVREVVEKAVVRIRGLMDGEERKVEKGGQGKVKEKAEVKTVEDGRVMLDLREWMHIVSIEALSAAVLSWSPGFLRDGSDYQTGEHGYMTWRRRSVFGLFPAAVKMGQMSKTLNRLWGRVWGITYPTPKGFRPFFPGVYRQVKRRINLLVPSNSNPKPKGDSRRDLLYDLIQLHLERPEFTDEYLRRMAVTNFGAGHETLAATLAAALAMIALDRKVQDKIHEELMLGRSSLEHVERVEAEEGEIQTMDKKQLGYTYLQACIKESQRLFPVISMSMVRIVGPRGLSFGDYKFPPGTSIGVSPTALHRSIDILGPDAGEYHPERWLTSAQYSDGTWKLSSGLEIAPYDPSEDIETTRKRVASLERGSLVWGAPGRTCPGRQLAEVIISEAVESLCREFEVEIDVGREEMEGGVKAYYLCVLFGVGVHFRARIKEGVKKRMERK